MKMRNIFAFMAMAVLLVFSQPAHSQAQLSRKGLDKTDKWIQTTFAKGAVPPFSFILDGVPSEKFIKSWDYKKSKITVQGANAVGYSIIYKDKKSGLTVTATVTGYTDFEAVEWVLRFTNTGKGSSGQIANVRSADFSLKDKGATAYGLRRLRGSDASVRDFEITEHRLSAEPLKLKPNNGRSSDGVSPPFFNITAEGADCGIVYSVGWTGTWCADFSSQNGVFTLKSGLADADFHLKAGESVRTPMASVLFWEGKGKMAGHNLFRRFVLAHHSHIVDGKPWAPLAGGLDWGDPAPCNEYTCLTDALARGIVRRYHQLDIMPEVIWLDAGWYSTYGRSHFGGDFTWGEVGDWHCDSERFPDGFVNLSNLIHSYGSELMVWFEPERVVKGTFFATEHPEFMLELDDEWQYIYNLADPKAVDWLCKYIGDFIEINGIDHYRQDFNTGNLALYWAAADERGRRGITEMKYIEGLYKYWDYLLTRFPKLEIDNCASGGRRLDLETISRATPLWRTDYQYGEPLGYQCQTYGINMFLPLSGTGIYKTDYYNSRAGYSSAAVLNFDMLSGTDSAEEMRRVYNEYKAIRPYYLKDYYPLSGYGDVSASDSWVAYQLHDASDGSGYVVAFRRPDCTQSSYAVDLQALSPNGTYIVTNLNTGEEKELYGGDMLSGYVLRLENAPDALLIKYVKE